MPDHPPFLSASVKVMRSYDYCHFEIQLASTEASTPEAVDALRKQAARLADKAVEQYQVAKRNAELCAQDACALDRLKREAADIAVKPEEACSPREKARLKAWQDHQHFQRRRYNYEDDFEESNFDLDEDEIF